MSNPLLEYQRLLDYLKDKTLEIGEEAFWEEWLPSLDEEDYQTVIRVMGEPAFGLRDHQIMPRVDALTQAGMNWRKWFLRMGRGSGKTHAASTNVNLFAQYLYPGCDGLLIGPDHKHVREVMIEGSSGLIALSPPDFVPKYEPGYSRVVWPNGSKAIIFTADDPQAIRGPTVYWAWGDELAKWKSEESYKNLLSTLRNKHPMGNRLILTTSPRSSQKWIRAIESLPDTITSVASSFANTVGLDEGALAEYEREVATGGKRAREEYLGEWVEDSDKLWDAQELDQLSVLKQQASLSDMIEQMDELVLSIDPGGKRDETGIILLGRQGSTYWVLGDFSMHGTKEKWERRVVEIRNDYLRPGDRVIVETNAHNDVDIDLRAILPGIYVEGKHQHSTDGSKTVRAERAHQLYERGQVRHFRIFPELHQQMEEFYEVVASKIRSPDRVDALATGLNWMLDRKASSYSIWQSPLQVRFSH